MLHLAKSFVLKLWLVLLLIIVLGALGISLGRLLLIPKISDYRTDVEQWASESLGRKVRVGKLKASWPGLGPELVLKDVELLSEETGNPTLRLSNVQIRLAILDSLWAWGIKTRQITLSGVQLLIKRRSNGALVIGGLEELEGEANDASPLFLLPSRIVLKDSVIFWENQVIGAEPVRLTNVVARLVNAPGRHQLNGSFELPGEQGGRLELAMDIRGELTQPRGWAGDIYLKGKNLALPELMRHRIPKGYALSGGQSEIEIWSQWDNGRISRVEGNAATLGLRLEQFTRTEGTPERAVEIDSLSGRFRWHRHADGWTLEIADIQLDRSELSWPTANFALRTRFDPEGRLHVVAGADFIRVEDMVDIIRMFPLPNPGIEKALDGIWPHSDLYGLQFNYNDTSGTPLWSARGEVRSLFTRPWKRIPGMSNLRASFHVDQSSGILDLNGSKTQLRFPNLLRNPLVLEKIDGTLSWGIREDGTWHIDTTDLVALTEDIRTRTRLTMEFPAPAQSDTPVFMDLQTDFSDGAAGSISRYLPVGIMPNKVVDWLDRSVIGGKVISGSCIFRGPLKGFPFHKTQKGRFEVFFHTEDLILDYWPGWPRLESVNGTVRFLNNSFDTWMEQGKLLDSRLKHAHGHIERLSKGSPFELTGVVDGPLKDELRILSESPLAERFGPLVKGMRGEGDARLALEFAVPIKPPSPGRLNGTLTFQDSELYLDDWGLALTGIRGDLLFDLKGVTGKGIRANTLDGEIRLDIKTPAERPNITRVQAAGEIPSDTLAKKFPGLGLQHLNGSAEWNFLMEVPKRSHSKDTFIPATLSSDLVGVTVALPAPLGKPPESRRAIKLARNLGERPQSEVRLSYGSLIDAVALIDTREPNKARFQRGEILLGTGRARLPAEDGLAVRGSLDYLNLTPWLEFSEAASKDWNMPLLRSINLEIGELDIWDSQLGRLDLNLRHREGALRGRISGSRFEGHVQIPDDLSAQPLKVYLQHLDIDFDPEQLSLPSREKDEKSVDADPGRLPALDIQVDKVNINTKDFGKLQLISRKQPAGFEVQSFTLNSDRMILSAVGDWQRAPDGGQHTRADITMETPALGSLLSDLGFTQNIDQSPTEIDSRLDWDDTPARFNPDILNGEISMQIGKGRFLEVNPGVGRVFGLLNFNALQRRLTLDFSDLFEKGFTFDNIEGSFLLDSGDAYTSDFRLRGPAASVEVAGRIGLGSEDFEQLVTVTPAISSTLPLAGALVGGPAMGAVVLFAQQLLGKEFDKISQRQYRVSGPWEHPVVDRLVEAAPERKAEAGDIFKNLNPPGQ